MQLLFRSKLSHAYLGKEKRARLFRRGKSPIPSTREEAARIPEEKKDAQIRIISYIPAGRKKRKPLSR